MRPIMHPTFMDDEPLDELPRRPRWHRTRQLGRMLRRVLLSRPFTSRAKREALEAEPWTVARVLRTTLHRLAYAPMVLALIVAAMVYHGTHPARVEVSLNPSTVDVYYDRVSLLAEDGTRLGGWLFPVVDEKLVLERKEKLLTDKHPAVLLVHHQGQAPDEMLPLVKPLHDAGMIVMIVGLRGAGTSDHAAQTFGLREAMDVKAAVEMLRRRPFVDPQRIAVVGTGTGATASLLAMREDANLRALVLDEPVQRVEQIMTEIGPRHPWLAGLRPMCKWAFEVVYQVDAEDIALAGHYEAIVRSGALMLNHPGAQRFDTPEGVRQVTDFLRSRLSSQVAGM
jgi:hypothetical protein